MNKKYLIMPIVAALSIITLTGCSKDATVDDAVDTATSQLADNISQRCTYDTAEGSGVTYFAGSMIRSEVSTMENGSKVTIISIIDDEWSYIWTDGASNGVKTSLASGNAIDLEDYPDADPKSTYDEDSQDYVEEIDEDSDNYTCVDWDTDKSYFVPPADVDFKDLTVDLTDTSSSEIVELCDLLTGDAHEECVTEMDDLKY